MKDARLSRPSSLRDRATRVSCVVLMSLSAVTQASTVAQVRELVDGGQFKSAEAQISQGLSQPSLSSEDRQALAFERERMRRMLLDFSLTAEDAQARVRRQIPDLAPAEFAAWDAAGLHRAHGHRRPDALFQACAIEPLPSERCRGQAPQQQDAAVDGWTQRNGQRASPRSARPGVEDRQTFRGAAPRARDLLPQRESGCGAGRRDAARVAAVSARIAGPAGKRAPGAERAGGTPHRAGIRVATHRLPGAARGGRQADGFFDHL